MRTARELPVLVATLSAALATLGCVATPARAQTPETPVTEVATAVSGTEATLQGEINPGSSAESVEYQFAYNAGTQCTGGLLAPEPPGEAGGNHVHVSATVSGLEGSTEYTFCLVAFGSEESESAQGTPMSFTTAAEKPVVLSENASAVTPFAATLEAEVNPENQPSTSCVIEYGLTTAYTSQAACEPAVLEGSSPMTASVALGGLQPSTTYHYRIVVEDATGVSDGPDAEFTTLTAEKPIVDGESVSGLSSDGAELEAQVNPNYQETSYHFEYGTNRAGENIEDAAELPGGSLPAAGEDQLAGPDATPALVAGTTYYYRVVATNAVGTTEGPIESFTTQAPPAVSIVPAEAVTSTTATFAGTVDPAGAQTTYRFVYIEAAAYELAVAQDAANPYAAGHQTAPVSAGAGYTTEATGPLDVAELTPGTTYRYALVATNSVGSITSAGQTFTTAEPTPPLVQASFVEGVAAFGATIVAQVETRGLPTSTWVQLASVPYGGLLLPASVTGASGSTISISVALTGLLEPSTAYYFRVIATNSEGTAYGPEMSFQTGASPGGLSVPFSPAALPFSSIAELDAREAASARRTSATKTLSRAQKLARALRACTGKPRGRRAHCRRAARRRYGASRVSKRRR